LFAKTILIFSFPVTLTFRPQICSHNWCPTSELYLHQFEVSTANRFQVNQRHRMDGQTDRPQYKLKPLTDDIVQK